MATIEERADTAIYEPKDGHTPVKAYEVIAYADGYERGASEQKKIDDEENGKALLYAVHKTEERTKKEMINKACKWIIEHNGDDHVIESFKEAMYDGNKNFD